MNEEQFKNKIEERWGHHERRARHGRVWTGLFLVVLGGFLLLKTANIILFPSWFFTWPILMIAIGLFVGLKHGFRGPLWIIFMLVGGVNLAERLDPTMHLDRFMWPVIFIAMGLIFIVRPKKNRWSRWRNRYRYYQDGDIGARDTYDHSGMETDTDSGDFLDVTSVFGGVKKNVLSKNFKGGDIVSFMGGSEIDLTQADFTGRIKIDVTNIFGGTKLIVPASWDVQNDITALFGGVDDKRQIHGVTMDPNKVVLLDGTCLFGGMEIRSY